MEIDQWNAPSSKNFKPLDLDEIEVDPADFWTNRRLSSSPRSTADELASNLSHALTSNSGRRFEFRAAKDGLQCQKKKARSDARWPRPLSSKSTGTRDPSSSDTRRFLRWRSPCVKTTSPPTPGGGSRASRYSQHCRKGGSWAYHSGMSYQQ